MRSINEAILENTAKQAEIFLDEIKPFFNPPVTLSGIESSLKEPRIKACIELVLTTDVSIFSVCGHENGKYTKKICTSYNRPSTLSNPDYVCYRYVLPSELLVNAEYLIAQVKSAILMHKLRRGLIASLHKLFSKGSSTVYKDTMKRLKQEHSTITYYTSPTMFSQEGIINTCESTTTKAMALLEEFDELLTWDKQQALMYKLGK